MEIFRAMEEYGTQQLVFCYDRTSGLRAIVAVHDTTLGPALGGCRMWPYRSEEEAVIDALRLSQGMTWKNAAMGLPLGGGKTVVLGDPAKDKSEALWRALGAFIDRMGGVYITAEDVGTTPEDMEQVAQSTRYVAGLNLRSGDPSPATAYGVYQGMRAALEVAFGEPSVAGRHVVVQGLGHVGLALTERLIREGAAVTVTDIYPDRLRPHVDRLGLGVIGPDDVYDADADVFAPCALGGVLNADTIRRLRVRAVCGAANNQLATAEDAERLRQRGIFYAPDFVVNGGGVIHVAEEFGIGGFSENRAMMKIARIYDQVLAVADLAAREDITTHEAALRLAERRLRDLGHLLRLEVRSRRAWT
ncbi:MAG: leucine dehydrogenase [Firmicutes bacterium]|nr:leucine dehydrogenase [Bacillota bacterium]